jgi:hypothetical protein
MMASITTEITNYVKVNELVIDGYRTRNVQRSKNTRDALPLASKWLSECMSSHSSCKPPANSILPSRLVHLDEHSDRVRLCATETFRPAPQYATLSHCWGRSQFLTLKNSNIEQFKMAIPPEALSKTFRDAISVTKALGLSYIWIDSLCIIQDNDEDWKIESRSMASVYGGSTINIAAASATDGSKGCFFNRRSSQTFIQLGSRRRAGETYRCVSIDMHKQQMLDLPLGNRGWCLQERLLPCRTLHFTSTEVFWECYEQLASECYPQKYPKVLKGDFFFDKKQLAPSHWPWITEHYSQCRLTHLSDKFVAISGIAEIIQRQNKDEYIAGLWKKDIETQLCWHVERIEISLISQNHQQQTLNQCIAPSWSWLFASSPISASKGSSGKAKLRKFIRVIDIQVASSRMDPYGPISPGILHIGFYYLFRYSGSVLVNEADWDYMIGTNLFPGTFFFDDLSSIEFDFEPLETDPLIRKPTRAIYVLPVIRHHRHFLIEGLLLHPTDRKDGEYRRIGVVNLDTYKRKLDLSADAFLPKKHQYMALNPDTTSGFRYIMEIV